MISEEDKLVRTAKAAHNTFAAYCKTIGDYSIKEWDEAEQWQRDDTVKMVQSVLAGTYSPKAEHQRWASSKVAKGYIYGPTKNDNKDAGPLTNPNLVDYEQLPISAKIKDHILICVTIGAGAHYDLTVAKVPDLVFA